jgi:hypothetical protein
MNKQFILDEIRRIAAADGGKAVGAAAFRTETGIKTSDWKGIYWVRWSDALIEAGFTPNQFTARTIEKRGIGEVICRTC